MTPLRIPVAKIVEYGDFECPYCGRAFPIVQQVRRAVGNRLRFVFRNFPLTQIHEHAEHAAEVAEAAAAQGTFWPMHDWLFHHQATLDDDSLLAGAREVGLDVERVRRELAEGTHRTRVREEMTGDPRRSRNAMRRPSALASSKSGANFPCRVLVMCSSPSTLGSAAGECHRYFGIRGHRPAS